MKKQSVVYTLSDYNAFTTTEVKRFCTVMNTSGKIISSK